MKNTFQHSFQFNTGKGSYNITIDAEYSNDTGTYENTTTAEVYCDMEAYGGGYMLVQRFTSVFVFETSDFSKALRGGQRF